MKVTKKEIVARTCYEICQKVLPRYSSNRGPKTEEFLASDVLSNALNLKKVPHSTICKAVKRLKEEDLKRLLEESAKLLNVNLEVLAIDYRIKRRQRELLLC